MTDKIHNVREVRKTTNNTKHLQTLIKTEIT